MTDLEITRLCAEAMGITFKPELMAATLEQQRVNDRIMQERRLSYDPLHDDAQAMALVKKFPAECFSAFQDYAHEHLMNRHIDLNHAICECVAKMMQAKRA